MMLYAFQKLENLLFIINNLYRWRNMISNNKNKSICAKNWQRSINQKYHKKGINIFCFKYKNKIRCFFRLMEKKNQNVVTKPVWCEYSIVKDKIVYNLRILKN